MFWEEVLSWIALCSNEVKVISFPDVFFLVNSIPIKIL